MLRQLKKPLLSILFAFTFMASASANHATQYPPLMCHPDAKGVINLPFAQSVHGLRVQAGNVVFIPATPNMEVRQPDTISIQVHVAQGHKDVFFIPRNIAGFDNHRFLRGDTDLTGLQPLSIQSDPLPAGVCMAVLQPATFDIVVAKQAK